MGAERFVTYGFGVTMQDAWNTAKEQAFYDHGHAGYSGTIAEKPGFIDFGALPVEDPEDLHDAATQARLGATMVEAIENKWDECAGFHVSPGKYVFVGWASC